MTAVSAIFASLLVGFSTQTIAQTTGPASTIPDGGRIVGNGQGLGANEISLGNAIEDLCPDLVARRNAGVRRTPDERDLQERCSEVVNARVNGVGVPELNNVLRELNVDEAAAQNRGLVELASVSAAAVIGRLEQLRLADAGQAGETVAYKSGLGNWGYHLETGGAAGDEDFGRWSVYLTGELLRGDRDQSALEAGFDLDGIRLTVGTDYRLNDNTFVGGSLDYITSNSDFDNGSELDTDGIDLTLYGTTFTETGYYFEGTVGFGFNDYQQDRRFTYTIPAVPAGTTSIGQTASGDTEGDQFFLSAGVGRDLDLGNGLLANFTGHLNYLDASVDGFTETISGSAPGLGMGLVVGDQDIESLRSSVGAQISKTMSTEAGVIAPFVRADWLHEFDNDSRTIIARFANDPFNVATTFALTTEEPDEDYFRFGGGVSAVFAGGLQGFIALDTVIGLSDFNYYAVTAGITKEL
jgi:outer membrane autotransporter protein